MKAPDDDATKKQELMSDGEDDADFHDCVAEEEFAKEFAKEDQQYQKAESSDDEEEKNQEERKGE